MAFDPDDFEKLLNRRKGERVSADRTNLMTIQQAAVKADAMTGDPAWDTFLSYLERSILENTVQRDILLRELSDPTLVNPDQIAAKRIALIQRNERLNVLSHVIAMPAQIKKLGAVAVEKLKQLDKLDTIEEKGAA